MSILNKICKKIFIKKYLPSKSFFYKKTTIAIFGSCVTLDSFRTHYNNYRKDFVKKYAQQRSTIISLMHPKIPYDNEDLEYVKISEDTDGGIDCLKKDFDKKLLDELDGADYLIINLLHDARLGVLQFGNSYITNNYTHLSKSDFYKKNHDKFQEINMKNNEKIYFNLFKESCDKFFKYLDDNYPDVKIVLQKVELTDYFVSKDGKHILRKDFRESKNELNPIIKKLENYVENNFDVSIISFPEGVFADENHIWGLHNTHFTKSYYNHVFNEMKIIVLENKLKELENKFF